MVDADPAQQSPDIVSGPEDMAFVEAPRERRLRRSNTAPKKQETGGLMGLIGTLRQHIRPELPERQKSASYRDEDARYMTEPERDDARRQRRDERRRRAMRPDPDREGYATDAGPAMDVPEIQIEDVDARREARRARRASRQGDIDPHRDSEFQEAEERRARRRERQRAREQEMQEMQLREEEERAQRRREEKMARRAAREERRAREEQEAREAEAQAQEAREAEAREAKAAERRERRRQEREAAMYENPGYDPRSRKRHSHMDDRAARDFYMQSGDPDRAYRSRRHGDDAEHARRRRSRAPEETRPAPMMPGQRKDKTSSWVNSQASDPPEPPPVVPTMLDMPPAPGEPMDGAHSISSDEEARRDLRRKARRRARYPGLTDQEIDEVRLKKREARRSERGQKSSSGSADYERDRGMRYDRYDQPPPSSGGKLPNWFKKLTSF
ncbi:hypothetical protein BDV36DRAFT_213047 [Aspergillus pseudocaelatus]|uniref:PITSLRE serine/threonine-protein kinase CDC2L1 n=1 Tax=Aspergillus pseudocaelatus TaxID=1825620 RepID=A0ABQ6WG88_9EURO|nr:hypothetical protein BDV36DRAFT_213047 [Aspergillus pseudocaelatus]